jgi:hypothetical protein
MNPFSLLSKPAGCPAARHGSPHLSLIALFYLLSILSPSLTAQTPASRSLFERLTATDSLEIRITTKVDSLLTDVFFEGLLPGKLQFRSRESEAWQEVQVGIGLRGKYRRMRCDFPLLRLSLDGVNTTGQDKAAGELRLMSHCSESDSLARQLLLKELLVYRLYNEISEASFRAKWLQVTYVNEADGREDRQVGLLIEDVVSLAARTNTVPGDALLVPQDSVSVSHDKVNALFQFMIGNVEWGYVPGRNIDFLRLEGGMYLPVVYNFDFSGFVNAPYVKPKTYIGQQSNRERIYFGRKISPSDLAAAFPFFLSKEKALKKLIRDYEELEPATRADLESYADEFFRLISGGEEAAALLLSRKPWPKQVQGE